MNVFSRIIGILVCFLAPALVLALSSDRDQPLQISAQRASLDDLQGVTIYEGGVEVTQGSMKLTADKVTLTYDNEKQIEKIIAEGAPAHFRQRPDNHGEDMQAQAKRMEYSAKEDVLHLITDAQVWQGGSRTKAQHIVYDAKRNVVNAEGGVKVEIPQQVKKKKEE